jgi:uncharacterized protein
MRPKRLLKSMLRIAATLLVFYIIVVAFAYFKQRSLLYFPSHGAIATALAPWSDGARTIGYCREVPQPRAIWLMMHGNAGQAATRDYVLRCLAEQDSLYVLEYPGYGSREGSPSRESFNQAASEAYQLLRSRHPGIPVCALGESVGSGPACALAQEQPAPDKIVLVVPFDVLASVASEQFPYLPVRLLLRDGWDNVESLRHYTGPVEIFGAANDTIVPVKHARALAKQIPGARFIEIAGGHNDWPNDPQVKLRR